MILNRDGASFEYAGVTYTVGGPVIGTDASEYHGLYGVITEIRDGDDKETENETPDIYCEFEPPVLPCEVKSWKRCSLICTKNPKLWRILFLTTLSWRQNDPPIG